MAIGEVSTIDGPIRDPFLTVTANKFSGNYIIVGTRAAPVYSSRNQDKPRIYARFSIRPLRIAQRAVAGWRGGAARKEKGAGFSRKLRKSYVSFASKQAASTVSSLTQTLLDLKSPP